jgi:hypothetical protein
MPARQRPDRADRLFTKTTIVTALRQAGLHAGHYWVIMGAALVLHGVRDTTSDIDIAVSDELFSDLLRSGRAEVTGRSGRRKVLLTPDLTAYKNWKPSSWGTHCGVQVATLDAVLEEKLILSRPKDLRDVDAIRRRQKALLPGEGTA